MDAKELRIGNYVNYFSESADMWFDNRQLSSNDISCIDGNDTAASIPLTEKWLKDNTEFENWGNLITNEYESYNRWVLHNFVYGTSNYEVHFIKSTYGGQEVNSIEYSIDNDDRQVIHITSFVHNLQNAIKQATGEELEIKN